MKDMAPLKDSSTTTTGPHAAALLLRMTLAATLVLGSLLISSPALAEDKADEQLQQQAQEQQLQQEQQQQQPQQPSQQEQSQQQQPQQEQPPQQPQPQQQQPQPPQQEAITPVPDASEDASTSDSATPTSDTEASTAPSYEPLADKKHSTSVSTDFTGWKKEGSQRSYYKDGTRQKNTALSIQGKVYSFSKTGAMMTGWAKIKGVWRYHASSGVAAKGWKKIGRYWYYFKNKGAGMLTGVHKIDGSWYVFAKGDSGRMLTGWQKVGKAWYYLRGGNSGRAYTGWVKSNNRWYYFNLSNAKMASGWRKIGGTWYYLSGANDGHMVTGTKTIRGVRYRFSASGALVSPSAPSGQTAGTKIFSQIPKKFVYTAGVGGWSTSIEIKPDGSFTGYYYAQDQNDGTKYECKFSGKFGSVKKINAYKYSMKLESLKQEKPAGEVSIVDGLKVITANPVGFGSAHSGDPSYRSGGEWWLYLPSASTANLPKDFVTSVGASHSWSWNNPPAKLPFHGLYNVKGKMGFFSS